MILSKVHFYLKDWLDLGATPLAFRLRDYQQDATQAVIRHFQDKKTPAVVVLPTGAGKSLVIAELARQAKRGRVLVLAHVKELVQQNYEKFIQFDRKASIFSAGLGKKDISKTVIFASVQSLARALHTLTQKFSLLIIDECHRVALEGDDQYHAIVNTLRQHNPKLCILGLTATPYRLGKGWIYNDHHLGFVRTRVPRFFKRCVYELPLRHLIDQNYLTPVEVKQRPLIFYDFNQLFSDNFSNQGDFTSTAVSHALEQNQRVTPEIIDDLLKRAKTRAGVMIFAANRHHATEVFSLLPPAESACITGETPRAQRDAIIDAFKQKVLKYLVNVSVLTTGFDVPHVDMIAILRPTASTSLYVQMVGRGLRLAPNKKECLLLDYAGNTFDLFQPEIGQPKPAPDTELVQVICPDCGFANSFWGRVDAKGTVIEHYGRRCHGFLEDDTTGETEYCEYRFQSRVCGVCGHMNDIAARVCSKCSAVLSDPDDRLKKALMLKDAFVLRCSGLSIDFDQADQQVHVTYHDEDGASLREIFSVQTPDDKARFKADFLRLHWHLPERIPEAINPKELVDSPYLLKHPDFVIAEKQKKSLMIVDKIFHYQGQYRKAHEMV